MMMMRIVMMVMAKMTVYEVWGGYFPNVKGGVYLMKWWDLLHDGG